MNNTVYVRTQPTSFETFFQVVNVVVQIAFRDIFLYDCLAFDSYSPLPYGSSTTILLKYSFLLLLMEILSI